jgi:hypothetical protein
VKDERDATQVRVDQVFGAVIKMTDSDLMAMIGFWTGGDADVRQRAWTKVRAVPKDDPRAKELEQSRDRVAQWVNDLGVSWYGAYERSIVVPSGADQGNLRRNAVPPILDAIVEAIFQRSLDEDERDELLEPLRRVMEPEPVDD